MKKLRYREWGSDEWTYVTLSGEDVRPVESIIVSWCWRLDYHIQVFTSDGWETWDA